MSKKVRLPTADAPILETKDIATPRGFRAAFVDGPTRAIPSLLGRKAVIVTDDRDLNIERKVTNIVMEDAGARNDSGPIGYTEFFSSPPPADILILRSSRVFSLHTDNLLSSLERFRRDNPKAAVVVCTFEHRIMERLQPLADLGVVNLIESRPPCDDHALLCTGADIFRKLQ
jgi:hypothetical protein